jgi:hypothetical protein
MFDDVRQKKGSESVGSESMVVRADWLEYVLGLGPKKLNRFAFTDNTVVCKWIVHFVHRLVLEMEISVRVWTLI